MACSTTPSDKSVPTLNLEMQIIPPITTIIPSPTTTRTLEPTSTNIPTDTATATITPTQTPTPTVDLSFYDTADCLPRNTLVQTGTVTQVFDGDTINVLFGDGKTYIVRYIGIDSPEQDMPFFTDAYNANSNMVLQKEVVLIKDISETDQYNRLLRYVIIDDVFVNLELVKTGFAKAVMFPPDIACTDTFSSAEKVPQVSQIGIWAATATPEPSESQVIIIAVDKREEYVDLQNIGDMDVDLTGWNLVSERGHQECYLAGLIKAGETLRVWAGNSQQGGYSCGYSSPIWNNSQPDPAVLYNPQGVEVSRK
jgi:endonuclease YncB( thermonuclease family)